MPVKPLSSVPRVDCLRLYFEILFYFLKLGGGFEALGVVSDMYCNFGEVLSYTCVVELNLEAEIIKSIDNN